MPRTRTTKGLAKRISLDFFKRKSPLRRLRSRMSWGAGLAAAAIGLAVVGLLGVRWMRTGGGPLASGPAERGAGARRFGGAAMAAAAAESVLSPGRLSEAHAMIERDCALCHGGSDAGPFLAKVSDETCTVCHDGPIHQESERFTPPCASCHAEHKGRQLAKVRDAACAGCHADLERALAPGAARKGVETRVTHFAPRARDGSGGAGHPDFAARTRPDTTRLKLNHKAHLALTAEWLAREGMAPLDCGSCHEPDRRQSVMAPVSYEKHCARCHRLEFDAGARFASFPPGSVAPHDTPRSVELFLARAFTEEIALRPGRLGEPDPLARPTPEQGPGRLLLGRETPPPPPRTSDEWVAREVAGAERILFRKDCALCHELSWPEGEAPGALPAVETPRMPERWLPRARFDHRSHRLLDCEACHGEARTSTATTDVLLPSLDACAACHRPGGSREDCGLCHDYHDKGRERPIRGTLTLPARAARPAPGDEVAPAD